MLTVSETAKIHGLLSAAKIGPPRVLPMAIIEWDLRVKIVLASCCCHADGRYSPFTSNYIAELPSKARERRSPCGLPPSPSKARVDILTLTIPLLPWRVSTQATITCVLLHHVGKNHKIQTESIG